ncbi:MAG: Chrysochromulina ericina virus [Bacteroidota bacterium]|jgi:GR25 family glycosyltransferase involved in LPS biosynthesis
MKNFEKFWDAAYVINLDFRQDRWNEIQKTANNAGLNVQRWDATKAADIDLEKHRKGTRVKKPSCIACWSSHIEIYRDALKKGYNRILVLEDDALIPEDLYEQLDAWFNSSGIVEFDLLYLGCADKYPSAPINDMVALSQYTLLTHAMLFTHKGLEKVIHIVDNEDDGKCSMSIDVFLAEHIQPQNMTYQITPSIIKTISSYSDIAGWKRSWDENLRSCKTQGAKNPKKWEYFEERAKTVISGNLINNKQLF